MTLGFEIITGESDIWPGWCLNKVCKAGHGGVGCLLADCASIQAQVEFHQPFSDEEDEGGLPSEGPHSKAQRLRGASQQSLTGVFLKHLPDQ